MASLFNIGLIDTFMPLFIFLFVFALVYAILLSNAKKIFGDNRSLPAIIAFVIGLVIATSVKDYSMIQSFFPPLIILLLFFIFLILVGGLVGVKPENFTQIFGGEKGTAWFIFIIVIIILIAILSTVYGPTLLEGNVETNETSAQDEFAENLMNAFFSEQVLGIVMLLLIAFFAIRFLAAG